MKIYINDRVTNEEEAMVSVYDHGFLYGIGLFETFRTYDYQPFLLEAHRTRLEAGCEQLGIAYQTEAGEWEQIVHNLLEANGLKDAYIRFTVTAGQEALGLPMGAYTKPSVVVYIKSLPPRNDQQDLLGKSLQLLHLPRNTPEGAVRLKSLHYMNNILAKRELQQYAWAEGAEGLLVDGQGHIAEGIVSNVFFVKSGSLYTPSLATGILPGITRAFVISLAEAIGVSVEEGLYDWNQVLEADEVFITNSIQEIVPVTRLFDPSGQITNVSNGTIGELTRRLMQLYRQRTVAVI
ncbi:4-amino-4-deoxychorismate lyase [Paenibacillus sp. 1_12]|uniref:aminodeoxychorismate lyase n=1 Tax=Paenibacillus sp. 1_12 TaxID=1566278 RepID=UPI0008E89555|nr:aminodeoxychorismate lyase [Paenibacillus sp. 1_12]SFM31394.1 4-amino-4-deoxychorismate lyase [Paenibacillus sp. 1_12]